MRDRKINLRDAGADEDNKKIRESLREAMELGADLRGADKLDAPYMLGFFDFDQQGNKVTHKFVLNEECLGEKKECVDGVSASYVYKGVEVDD